MATDESDGCEWTREKTLELIKGYKDRKSLWDPSDNAYFCHRIKNMLWEDLAESVGATLDETRRRMQSLLASMRRERARVRQSAHIKGKGAYKSNWFAYDSLSFLLDRQNPTGYNIVKTENLDDMDGSYDDSKDSESRGIKRDFSEEEEEGTLARQRLEEAQGAVTNSWSLATPVVEYEAATTTTTKSIRGRQPDCASFGRYVADKLASYSKTTKCAVQHAICEILFSADQGRFETYFQDYSTGDNGLDVAQDQESVPQSTASVEESTHKP